MKWYEFDKNRVVLEFMKVKRNYPNFTLSLYQELLAWEGEVNLIPEGIEAEPLRVRIVYPNGFPIRPPWAYPIEPEIPKEEWGHKWHRWMEGHLCYISPKLWDISYTTDLVIDKIGVWYFNYLAYKHNLIDEMPDEGMAPLPIKGGD